MLGLKWRNTFALKLKIFTLQPNAFHTHRHTHSTLQNAVCSNSMPSPDSFYFVFSRLFRYSLCDYDAEIFRVRCYLQMIFRIHTKCLLRKNEQLVSFITWCIIYLCCELKCSEHPNRRIEWKFLALSHFLCLQFLFICICCFLCFWFWANAFFCSSLLNTSYSVIGYVNVPIRWSRMERIRFWCWENERAYRLVCRTHTHTTEHPITGDIRARAKEIKTKKNWRKQFS